MVMLQCEQRELLLILAVRINRVFLSAANPLKTYSYVLKEIEKMYSRKLSIIGVLTKCDELAPPSWLPTKKERQY